MKRLQNDGIVFRERVSSFKNGGIQNNFDANLSWAGDNGIMLGFFVACKSLLQNDPNLAKQLPFKFNYSDLITNLLIGIKSYFITLDGNFINWARAEGFPGDPPGKDPWDYNTGIGVLLRNIRAAYDSDDILKKEVYDLFG